MAVRRAKERSQRIQAYVPESFARQLLSLGRLWSIQDRAEDAAKATEKKEPLKEWTESEILKRLLEFASEAAWKEVDGGEPKTEEEWAQAEEQARRQALDAARKEKKPAPRK
jgi:hypothetical protein